ncbi:MAG TPA: cyclic nucleotide-binding domain-containing protein [Methylomirabilota bacterium]|nr:cyclic nucleotide-binding domain-containing protein [Methylomirabilota bacterium]
MSQQAADLNNYRTILANSVVFQGLRPTDLDPVLSSSDVIARKPGELILSEGTPGDGLYIVLEGEIEIFLPERAASGAHRPTRVRLNRLGPGRCLGEYGVIDDQPSSASAAALTPARLCFLPKAEFRRLVERHDRVARIVYANLLRYLVSRLRGKDKELDIIVLDDKP